MSDIGSASMSDDGELMDDHHSSRLHKHDQDEILSVSDDDEDEGVEDSLNIKPPQSSKVSGKSKSRHSHSSQSSKRDRHLKKARRSKERHRSNRLSDPNAIRYPSSTHRVKEPGLSHKHRPRDEHRHSKEQGSRDSRNGKDTRDAREILKKLREERDVVNPSKESSSRERKSEREKVKEIERESHRERDKDVSRETFERERRRERFMMAEREREQRFHRRKEEKNLQSTNSSDNQQSRRRADIALSKSGLEVKDRHDRSRSPVSRRRRRDQLNEKLKEKLNEIKSDDDDVVILQTEDEKSSANEELVVNINDNEGITSDDKSNSSENSDTEKEEGEHSDDSDENKDAMDVDDENNAVEDVSESESSSSSGATVDDEEESSSGEQSDSEESVGNVDGDEANSKVIKVESEEEQDEDDKHAENNHDATENPESPVQSIPKLPPYLPAIQGCRSVEEFSCLNRIEEGTFGVVYRARDKKRDEIVALKRLKMENEKEGFPITSLREINTLLKAQHDNIVTCREIVVGSNMDKIYIVMDYVEHDLKSLMEGMKQPFLIGEVKTLLIQLLRAVAHLHDNWILHRDLKTSNLLLSHKGVLKVGDFGLAREYGSPLKPYTPIVVTLWYRAPELLLGIKEYSCPIDLWSVGCIMAEFLNMKPLFPGKSEVDQINRIFKDLGTPSETIWPGYSELPMIKKMNFANVPYNTLRSKFGQSLDTTGFELLNRFLTYDPKKRITADEGLAYEWFKMVPKPVSPAMFPTWPAKSEQVQQRRAAAHSPKPPSGGKQFKLLEEADERLISNAAFHMNLAQGGNASKGPGFTLKF